MIAISLVRWGSSLHFSDGEILTLSCVLLRDGGARFESGTRYFYGHYSPASQELLYKQIRELYPELELDGVA
jgi:hypothetical protein